MSRGKTPAEQTSANRRAGTAFERKCMTFMQRRGFTTWERAPLRGNRDLLDTQGCLSDGWMIGFKSIQRGVPMGDKMSAAMLQCRAAMATLAHILKLTKGPAPASLPVEDVIPVQVLQRAGYEIHEAYVVMEYGDFMRLAAERRAWRATGFPALASGPGGGAGGIVAGSGSSSRSS